MQSGTMTTQVPFRFLIAAAALTGWTGLILRFYLTMTAPDGPAPLQSAVRYFSFFTIQTNILAAAILTAWAPHGNVGWLARPGVRAAAVVYLGVVGVVYSILLRDLWDPRGLAKFCDVVLHDLMPVLYALCWLLAAGGAQGPAALAPDRLVAAVSGFLPGVLAGTRRGDRHLCLSVHQRRQAGL
jgi:hypothetical protein